MELFFYKSWFEKTVFRVSGAQVIIVCSSDFIKNELDIRYRHIICQLLEKEINDLTSCQIVVEDGKKVA